MGSGLCAPIGAVLTEDACASAVNTFYMPLMRKHAVFITGAGGEIGYGLLTRLAGTMPIVSLDINPLDSAVAPLVTREFTGSIADTTLLERVSAEFEVDLVFHLAALLSTRSESAPVRAHYVNVDGTLNLLEFARKQGESHGRPVVFVYPSSVAVYGVPNLEVKMCVGRVREDQYLQPTTIYGCNKLYCEQLGRYYMRHFNQLSTEAAARHIDFRCVRFPGLISAATVPTGGTSDYAPEMFHAAAKGEPYACFVRPDSTIPFMSMPDAINALLTLASVPSGRLTRTAYNVGAFSASAAQIHEFVLEAFPEACITYEVDEKRQAIVDSWPAEIDDSAARADWGFAPTYDLARVFDQYLIPALQQRYEPKEV